MPCYHPLQGYRSKADGKSIVFNPAYGWVDRPITIPCGQCIGCRLERSRQWAMRCVHESQLHEDNSFITLTYDNEHLPEDRSLHKEDFQDFMKRLRKKFVPKNPFDKKTQKNKYDAFMKKHGIRYYHCGEYGEQCKNCGQNKMTCESTTKCWEPTFGRPHYHAILFGIDFDDKELYTIINGERLYKSDTLSRIWGKGFVSIGSVTFESAAYVARYVMKKINGKDKEDHYLRVDYSSGEVINPLEPEYTTMSRRPGIAADWFRKYKDDVFPSDNIHLNGKTLKPPKFYDKMFTDLEPLEMEKVKKRRMIEMHKHRDDNTPQRLLSKEKVKQAQLNKLVRNL